MATRPSGGQVRVEISDDELYAAYEQNGRDASSLSTRLNCSPSQARRRVAKMLQRKGEGPMMTERADRDVENLIEHELRLSSMAHEGSVIKSCWVKGKHLSVHLQPDPGDLPAWPVVQPAPVATIRYAPVSKPTYDSAIQRIFIWPDSQIAFHRSTVTDELIPFHDLDAIDVGLQVLHAFKPDRVVLLGDFLDLPSMSRYLQVAEFSATLQPSIHYGYELLCTMRSAAGPNCKFDYLAGNHERRLAETIATNARAAYGLRNGGNHDGWPQLSVPALLNLESLGVEYSAEYPGGQVWLSPKLVCQHQNPEVSDLRASIIHGHNERRKLETRAIHSFEGVEFYETWCFPGFGNIHDVADKTMLNRTMVASNRTRKSANQGFGLVYLLPDGRHHVVDCPVVAGSTMLNGLEYRSTRASAEVAA